MKTWNIKFQLGFEADKKLKNENSKSVCHIPKNYAIFDELYYNLENIGL